MNSAHNLPSTSKTVTLSSEWTERNRLDLTIINQRLFPERTVFPEIFEVFGKEGSGKTELLMHIIVSTVLLKTYAGIPVDGLDCGVVYIDLDYHFNIVRFTHLLEICTEKRLIQNLQKNTCHFSVKYSSELDRKKSVRQHYAEDRKALFKIFLCRQDDTKSSDNQQRQIVRLSSVVRKIFDQALKNFHYVKCNSTEMLAVTLHSLERLFESERKVGVVVLDSVSSLYWLDRLHQETGVCTVEESERSWLQVLQDLVRDYGVSVLAAKQVLMYKRHGGDREDEEPPLAPDMCRPAAIVSHNTHEHMGRAWQRFVQGRFEVRHLPQTSTDDSRYELQFICKGEAVYSTTFTITDDGIQ